MISSKCINCEQESSVNALLRVPCSYPVPSRFVSCKCYFAGLMRQAGNEGEKRRESRFCKETGGGGGEWVRVKLGLGAVKMRKQEERKMEDGSKRGEA